MDINDQIINAATKIGILTCKNNKISIVDVEHDMESLNDIVYFLVPDDEHSKVRKVGESENWENRKQSYGNVSCSTNKKIIKTMKDQKWKSANVYALPIEKENFEKLDSVTGENVTISFAPTKRWEEHYDNKLRESGVQQLLSKTNRSRDISIRYAKDYQDILDAMNMSERQFKKSTSAPVRNFIILNQAEKQLSKKELVKMCKDAGLR